MDPNNFTDSAPAVAVLAAVVSSITGAVTSIATKALDLLTAWVTGRKETALAAVKLQQEGHEQQLLAARQELDALKASHQDCTKQHLDALKLIAANEGRLKFMQEQLEEVRKIREIVKNGG